MTEPGCNGIYPAYVCIYLTLTPDIYRCIRSNRDRLGFFVENQIIFGTVCVVPLLQAVGSFMNRCLSANVLQVGVGGGGGGGLAWPG